MSDGKLLNDHLVALREACGMSDGPGVLEVLARAAALAREAMAARAILRPSGNPWTVHNSLPKDGEAYAAARAANGNGG